MSKYGSITLDKIIENVAFIELNVPVFVAQELMTHDRIKNSIDIGNIGKKMNFWYPEDWIIEGAKNIMPSDSARLNGELKRAYQSCLWAYYSLTVEGDFTQDSLKYSVVENLQAEDSKKKDNPPNGWKIISFYDEKNTNYQLQRIVKCKSFEEVKSLIKIINQIADELNHHPLVKYQFNSVVINLWTHDTNSLIG